MHAMERCGAKLLLHPVVGRTKPGDINYFTRVRCYENILKYYPKGSVELSLLPLAMRMAGPKEALWHAIIRKNYGCNNFIVGRDHAGPGTDLSGKPYYAPYAAQELVSQHTVELGMTMLEFEEMVYLKNKQRYVAFSTVGEEDQVARISGTQLRDLLRTGANVPLWFSYPEVIAELRKAYPPKNQQGFTVFFTGLSGAGKSTLANALRLRLLERGIRTVSLLDGDVVRKHLSTELGFSKAHRNLNIQRIGYVASEITLHGGIAICAPIAPYRQSRRQVRELVSQHGGFIEVYLSTPLATCEARDRKGLYYKARRGIIHSFTGISDPGLQIIPKFSFSKFLCYYLLGNVIYRYIIRPVC
jgi:sulfate adenylyltransferase